jgi:hypothetical protein
VITSYREPDAAMPQPPDRSRDPRTDRASWATADLRMPKLLLVLFFGLGLLLLLCAAGPRP